MVKAQMVLHLMVEVYNCIYINAAEIRKNKGPPVMNEQERYVLTHARYSYLHNPMRVHILHQIVYIGVLSKCITSH